MAPQGRHVLVADHEAEVGEMSRRYLSRAGLDARVVITAGEALSALAGREADLFVLDLTMPGLEVPAVRRALLAEAPRSVAEEGAAADGLSEATGERGSVARAVLVQGTPLEPRAALRRPDRGVRGVVPPGVERAAANWPPAVFLLDRHGIRPRGLVDGPAFPRQWLARPFSPRALVEAVTGLLAPRPATVPCDPPGPPAKATGSRAPARAGGAGLRLDGDRREIAIAGQVIALTRTEFSLVSALAREPGRALSRQQLLAELAGERGKRPTARAVDVYVTQLRAKLGAGLIKTVHGIGYRLGDP